MAALLAVVKTPDEARAALAAGADLAAVVAATVPETSVAVGDSHLPGGAGWMIVPASAGVPAMPLRDLGAGDGGTLWLPLGDEPIDLDGAGRPPSSPDGDGAGWEGSIRAALTSGHRVVRWVDPDSDAAGDPCTRAQQLGLSDLLIATPPFSGRQILGTRPIATLAALAQSCRAAGLRFGFAGAVEGPDIPRLLSLAPDVIGFDTALRDEADQFDAARVAAVRALLTAPETAAARTRPDAPDRIFVRDWTVSMSIGAYARERGRPQRVRFTVAVDVAPADSQAGFAGVVSYDLITDAIARLATEHIDLVEELAERLGGMVLTHPRVLAIDITVEKLDLGPGSVGCRIRRERDDG